MRREDTVLLHTTPTRLGYLDQYTDPDRIEYLTKRSCRMLACDAAAAAAASLDGVAKEAADEHNQHPRQKATSGLIVPHDAWGDPRDLAVVGNQVHRHDGAY